MASEWDGDQNEWEPLPTRMDKLNNLMSTLAMSSGFILAILVFVYLWNQT